MKLVAMMIVRNEIDRYLRPVLDALLSFCDEVRVIDDGSTDGTAEYLEGLDRVGLKRNVETEFFRHEGRARQSALVWAHKSDATHVLAVDADELVTGGQNIRAAIAEDERTMVWTLDMQEIWKADPHYLYVRMDGGWRSHQVPIMYRTVRIVGNARTWQIPNRALASGRVPMAVAMNGRKAETGADILHLGWACQADRAARYARYTEHDGGKFHRNDHLLSIMWGDDAVRLRQRPWPTDLDPATMTQIYKRIQRGTDGDH